MSRPTRADFKRLGARLSAANREAAVAEARARGVVIPDGWPEMPGKKLLRLLAARSDAAQVASTPTARDEGFTCAHCGCEVPPGSRRPRDHCHQCLHSRHVDVVPGDRASECGGDLVPVAVVKEKKGWMIEYRCAACGAPRRNRVLDDLVVPDDPSAVRRLVALGAGEGVAGSGSGDESSVLHSRWRRRP